jgi:hypothetical protein
MVYKVVASGKQMDAVHLARTLLQYNAQADDVLELHRAWISLLLVVP